MTEAQVRKFIAIRDASGFNSNLQFQIDLEEAGLRIEDLGPVTKQEEGVYSWSLPVGELREVYGQLFLV